MTNNCNHHLWHGLKHLVWEKSNKRKENENLINIRGKEIHIQREPKYLIRTALLGTNEHPTNEFL